eukprot:912833-Pyramimonas_sp.AAC.1
MSIRLVVGGTTSGSRSGNVDTCAAAAATPSVITPSTHCIRSAPPTPHILTPYISGLLSAPLPILAQEDLLVYPGNDEAAKDEKPAYVHGVGVVCGEGASFGGILTNRLVNMGLIYAPGGPLRGRGR